MCRKSSNSTTSSDSSSDSSSENDEHNFGGGKTIGMFASVALLINNITGPGVPSLPNMFAEAGWLVPTIVFLLIWAMSSLSTTMYCEAMRQVPGNEHFSGRIEYTSIVKHYFGQTAYVFSQIGLNGALQSLNIISVIQSAQVMDSLVIYLSPANSTYGIDLTPIANYDPQGNVVNGSTSVFSSLQAGADFNPWGCHAVLSVGFVVALLVTVPMGIFNLDDNMIIQSVAFVITLVCWAVWFVACFFSDSFSEANSSWTIPAVKSGEDYTSQAGVLGTILFNFGFVTTVPSWVNEKRPSVSVNKAVWLSSFLCIVIFFVIGIPGCMAFQDYLAGPATGMCKQGVNCKQDIMGVLTDPTLSPASLYDNVVVRNILVWSVYLFPIVAVMSSIPVFSIVIKYNCIENGFSRGFSVFWGVVFPWIVAIPLSWQPDALNNFINFSSLVFVSFTDFIVPWALYIILQRRSEQKAGSEALLKNDAEANYHDGPLMQAMHDPIAGMYEDEEAKDEVPEGVVVHYALPTTWSISPRTKTVLTVILVVFMTAGAVVATIQSIEQTGSDPWVCSNVSGF